VHLYKILSRPLITEKNTGLKSQGKYAFEVDKEANKHQIKEAVQKAFKVEVLAVNVMTMPGKTRRIGRRQVLTQSWKKAIVTLKAGNSIAFFEGV
jgi:large subunit ribosomal protein L23